MHEQLIKEIQKMVRDGEVPAKSVAEAVGKPYSTLMREINPYQGREARRGDVHGDHRNHG